MSLLSVAFGWESVTLLNHGLVMATPVKTKMSLRGIQVCCSLMFTAGATGASNVLFTGCVMPNSQWGHWPIPGDLTQCYIALAGSPDFGIAGFAGAPRGGGFGGAGQMFAIIVKTNAPTAQNVVQYIPFSADGMPVNVGDGIFFHMDHMGAGPCDPEMQGTLFYTVP
jgi:hypothetical protein